MSTALEPLGNSTLAAEITHISQHGVWILLNDRELFMSFHDFPWFRHASIAAIHAVEWLNPRHLYWPQLDVDLLVESIEQPERFPLLAR